LNGIADLCSDGGQAATLPSSGYQLIYSCNRALLAVNNLLVVIDLVVLPTVDLVPLRNLASLAAVSVLLFGFVWETE
jgi:hypothetical protein